MLNGNLYQKMKVRGKTSLYLFSVILSLSAPLVFGGGAWAQSRDVVNRLNQLEKDIETLNQAVYKGQIPEGRPVAGTAGDAEGTLVRLQQLETDVRTLTGKVEQQSYDIQQMQSRLDSLSQIQGASPSHSAGIGGALSSPTPPSSSITGTNETGFVGGVSGGGALLPQTGAITPPPPAVTGGDSPSLALGSGGPTALDASSLYEQGFTSIKNQDYETAEQNFALFMQKYPDHALAPNAIYWLGETYYARKNYKAAAKTFAEGYQKFPGGPKGADNLLKLGLSLAGDGKKTDACVALGQLRKEYASGPAPVLTRGDQELKTLGCP